MYRLDATNRCQLFELIAEEVWDSIVYNHRRGLDRAEIGITKDIIAVIQTHHDRNRNFGVWSGPGKHESDYGSDIDVFVETETNYFLWYALQAKVLKFDGIYDGLIQKKQWAMLNLLRSKAGCIPYFLFFNGQDKIPDTIQDSCGHSISEKQLGCSIVELDKVEKVASSIKSPQYSDFYPKQIHPWRELVCCTARTKSGNLFPIDQVWEAVSLYQSVVNGDILVRHRPTYGEHLEEPTGTNIRSANESSGREPALSLVVRSTAGINQ